MVDKRAPDSQLRLEWVFGYRGHQCRNNLLYTATNEIVYFVAGVGIIYNIREHSQRFFLGHDDDIISLTLNPERVLCATGQVGKSPRICVWNTRTCETVSLLQDGHQQGVACLAFSTDGLQLVSVGMDQHSMINVWNWKKGQIIATTRGHTDRIFDVQYNGNKVDSIITCGVKHIKFWSLSGNTLSSKKGIFGKVGEIQSMLCISSSCSEDITCTGSMSGQIYVWRGQNLSRVVDAHKGAIYSMFTYDDGFVTGGKDSQIKVWTSDVTQLSKINLAASKDGYKGLVIRSVCKHGDRFIAGTQGGEIYDCVLGDTNARCLLQGHAEGELWALDVHPKKGMFATASDDRTVRLWNMTGTQLISRRSIAENARSCAFSPDGTTLGVGLIDGSFMVLRCKDLQEICRIHERKEVIHEMKYSPDGAFLAVGSNDNFVDVYAVQQKYKKVGQCSGNSSFITHLDWSEDSKALQTNSGAAEHLFYRMPAGKQLTNKEELSNIRWASWTSVLGPQVNGIWEKYTDTNDVNALHANTGAHVCVTGDDFGLVKLFKYPSCQKGAKYRKYVGHSAHVTNVRWSADKQKLISIGGGDHAIFQWKFIPEGISGGSQEAYMDSNSEDSDSDVSDVEGIDSDLEAESKQSYDRSGIGKDDINNMKRALVSEDRNSKVKRDKAPDDSLTLTFVHGYRGYDCRNNLFYLKSGEIVYHVAALAVLFDKSKHSQRFYQQHTDDILCLTPHPSKPLIATGQVGKKPTIHIWDQETLKTISILSEHHERGICAVDFSADGKRLASIGLDDNHSMVVWDWRKGEKLATTRGHKDKIFAVKWDPHNTGKLVTVGMKHMKFWTQTGGGFTSKRATFGSVAKIDTMMTVVFAAETPDLVYTGGASGQVYVWAGLELQRVVKAHEGPCFTLHSLDKGFASGGKDGVVSLWDEAFERPLKSYSLKRSSLGAGSRGVLIEDTPPIRSVVLGEGRILVGTRNAEVIEIAKDGEIQILVQGHKEGEIWGLAIHPLEPQCATASDDKHLCVWSTGQTHRLLAAKVLAKPARCVAFSPDGRLIAVGMKDGSFAVFKSDTLENVVNVHHRKEEISDIKFSPVAGKYLAVASHDNFVDIYNTLTNKRVGVCKASSSYITHIDWDCNGKVLVTNSGAKEQLFFEAPRGKRHTIHSADVDKMNWSSWTGVLGSSSVGIWPRGSDVTDINAASVSSDRTLVATGDDFGYVKLFQFPCRAKNAKHRKYLGHSAHVTNVRWSADDRTLLTTGGADTALLVWSRVGEGGVTTGRGACRSQISVDSDDNEDYDQGGYDSDVAREKDMDYSTKTYQKTNNERTLNRKYDYDEVDKPQVSRNTSEKSKVAKRDSLLNQNGKKKKLLAVSELQLESIMGYRGFDCRNNLHYISDGAEIVYHAAAAAIVTTLATGVQRHYLEHSDDILCLAVNQHPKHASVVATGQLGTTSPEIRVWSAANMNTLSVLKGFHTVGVCYLDFSYGGKLLVSVGLDAGHSVAVWRWQEGTLIASTRNHPIASRLFVVQFRPDTDTEIVGVGVCGVKFWSVVGSALQETKAKLADVAECVDRPRIQTMLSVAFATNNTTFTGAMSGDIYVWKDCCLVRMIRKAHDGPVFTMYTSLRDGLILSGAKEASNREGGPIKLWDQEMKRCRPFSIPSHRPIHVVKSLCRCKGQIIVGTKDSEIFSIVERTSEAKQILSGHAEGDLCGLVTLPKVEQFLTASDDGTVKLWDASAKKLLQEIRCGPARSVDVTKDGEMAAVGLKNGGLLILATTSLKVLGEKRDRGSFINVVRFSEDSRYLAVGSEEGYVDLYDLSKGSSLARSNCTNQLSGGVQTIDFSTDHKYMNVGTNTYVNQVIETNSCKEITDPRKVDKITWAGWTSIVGEEVNGIWEAHSNKADVNSVHVSHGGHALAIGNDFGSVKLYDFPCKQQPQSTPKIYGGHSAYVTKARFTYSDRYLISTGGEDCCVFIWKCKC